MTNFIDKSIAVTEITGDSIEIQVGPNGYSIPKTRLEELMRGVEDPIETLIRNIAIRLRLSGVSLDQPIAVKQAIEYPTFKLPE